MKEFFCIFTGGKSKNLTHVGILSLSAALVRMQSFFTGASQVTETNESRPICAKYIYDATLYCVTHHRRVHLPPTLLGKSAFMQIHLFVNLQVRLSEQVERGVGIGQVACRWWVSQVVCAEVL